ncbi:MAG: 4Fe-4S binding protein, partial [Anaerolineae bacterium]|nr:4Fe-4S binding protein [Anaerolineae bacterium]
MEAEAICAIQEDGAMDASSAPHITKSRCTLCGLCVSACPEGV